METHLSTLADAAWRFGALPVLVIVSVTLMVRLRAPQLRLLAPGLAGIVARDPSAPGHAPPAVAAMLSAAAVTAPGAVLGTATALSLGGVGALAWIWLFAFLLAPLRYAEVVLSRTSGAKGAPFAGSLPRRLFDRGSRAARLAALLWMTVLTAGVVLYAAGPMGGVARELGRAAHGVAPIGLVGGAALVAAVVVLLGPSASRHLVVGLGAIAVIALAGVLAACAADEPGRALGVLTRFLSEAFLGAPEAGAFTGALAGEIAGAAIAWTLPTLTATLGLEGAIHADAKAPTAHSQGAVALVTPLVHVGVATLFTMSVVASGAYYELADDARPMSEVVVLRARAESTSQRAEPERLYEGYLRIIDGELRDVGLHLATARGPLEEARFVFAGRPADVALHIEAGRVRRVLVREGTGLRSRNDVSARDIEVEGRMLPRGGALAFAALGSPLRGTITLGAVLALLGLASAALGLGLARTWSRSSGVLARAVGLVSPLALALGAGAPVALAGALGAGAAAVGAISCILAAVGIVAGARAIRVAGADRRGAAQA